MRKKPPLRNPKNAAIAKLALQLGYVQHVIAAYFSDNQGRVSELNTGKLFPGLAPYGLPVDFVDRKRLTLDDIIERKALFADLLRKMSKLFSDIARQHRDILQADQK